MELNDKNDTDANSLSASGGYSHASIVCGGNETDREGYAYRMAQAMLCSGTGSRPCRSCPHCNKSFRNVHPDIIFIDRLEDARNIQVDQIRALKEDAVIMPNEASTKVYILRHADTMNVQAQNAILKLLEEPPKSSNFILVAENPAELLTTVRSRCVELTAEKSASIQRPNETVAAFYAALLEGALSLNAFSFTLEKLDRSSFIDFLDGARVLMAEKLRDSINGGYNALMPEYLRKTMTVLNRAKIYFDSNVSLVHIAGMICAELI